MIKNIMLLTVATLALAGCDGTVQTGDQIQNQKQEELTKQGVEMVGVPAITNFQEKRLMKNILELRDRPDLVTYTYIVDLNGHTHKVCDSIGYGLPYATQYTNPQRVAGLGETPNRGNGNVTLPQADPNGLYSPAAADGTWVLCKVPGKDKVTPQYIEPHVIVTTFPLSM
jgi:hypothetical protein